MLGAAQETGHEFTSLHAKGHGICQRRPGLRLPVVLVHIIHPEYLPLLFVHRDRYVREEWQ